MSISGEIEFVLPSGKFCNIRPLRVRDRIAAFVLLEKAKAKGETIDLAVALAMQATKIDGEALTYEQYLDLDVRDDGSIQKKLVPFILGPVQSNESR